jgi:basic amino acid/polyamine antiporter, APA family
VPSPESMVTSSSPVPKTMNLCAGPELTRMLRLRDLVLLIIGTVIGSGIFLVPGLILEAVGNSLWLALCVWLLGGMLSLLGALTYGELSAVNPQAGGLYVYIRDCFGRFAAFLFGWTLFLVVSTGSIATLAVAFSNYLGEFVPLTAWGLKLVSLSMIGVIAAVNVIGTRRSADLQNFSTVVKVSGIVAIAVLLLWFGKGAHVPTGLAGTAIPLSSRLSGIGIALVSVLWAYEGWQYATFAAGEAVNPRHDFPRAFLAGIFVLAAVYILANLGYVRALGPAGVAKSNRVAATAIAEVFSPAAAKLVTLVILISIFSAANSVALTGSRVFYAMARDGVFFRRLAEIHPRFATPAFAVGGMACWAAVLAATGTFEQLLTYVVFVGWAFYALGAASIFVYRKRYTPDSARYRVPGYPWTPVVFIATVAAVVANTILAQPVRAAIGIGVVLTGAPAYLIWKKR